MTGRVIPVLGERDFTGPAPGARRPVPGAGVPAVMIGCGAVVPQRPEVPAARAEGHVGRFMAPDGVDLQWMTQKTHFGQAASPIRLATKGSTSTRGR
jgi:hypothetical protein